MFKMVPASVTAKSRVLTFAIDWRTVNILIFCLLGAILADDVDQDVGFCPDGAIVDLTYAIPNASGFLAESGYFFPRELTRSRAGLRRGCICDLKPCLPVCPSRKKTKTGKTHVADDYANYSAIPPVYFTNETIDDDEETRGPEERFRLVTWTPCPDKGKFFLDPEAFAGDEFHLLGNGSLFLPRRTEERILDFRKYCLQVIGNDSSYTPKVCSSEDVTDPFIRARYVGGLVAVPFLIATVIVYSVLPELRNIHGKTLRCYLCCLVVTHVALAADRIPTWGISTNILCFCRGFINYGAFVASFFWLNVMCFDIWWTFGGVGSLRNASGQNDRKKFYRYSLYAWGIPSFLTAICVFMEFTPGMPPSIVRPGFKLRPCWFNAKASEAFYFYGPVGATIACNICLFVLTLIKISQHNKDTGRHLNNGDSRSYDNNKKWFSLYLKFFIVMGISWSTEIISWLWERPKYFWYVTDMVNALQGFLIFLIFVCKKNTCRSLRENLNVKNLHLADFRPRDRICKSRKSAAPGVTDDQKNQPQNSGDTNSHVAQTDGLQVADESVDRSATTGLTGRNLHAYQNIG